MLPICMAVGAVFHTLPGKCCPGFGRWSRRYAVHFTAVDTACHTTARGNASCFSAFGVGVILPILLRLVPPFALRPG